MPDQPIRTLVYNPVILNNPDVEREESSQDRDRPLPDHNSKQHEKYSRIEDPLRQRPDPAIPKVQRHSERDPNGEDNQGHGARATPHLDRPSPSKPGNQHCPE